MKKIIIFLLCLFTACSVYAADLGPVPPDDTAYNAATWNGDLRAPTKNAVRDKFEAMVPGGIIYSPVEISKTITNPTSSDDYIISYVPTARTISGVVGACTGGTSVTYKLQQCTNANLSTCSDMTNEFTVTSGNTPGVATVSVPAAVATNWLKLLTGTVTGLVTYCTVTVYGVQP